MEINELKGFLNGFDVDLKLLDNFLKGKRVVEKDKNIFLREQGFKDSQVYGDLLVFVNLKKLLPSKFLLKCIAEMGGNVVDVISEKKALDFTYGKDLKVSDVEESKFEIGKNYVVMFEGGILGYGIFDKILKNKMNVGDFLKE